MTDNELLEFSARIDELQARTGQRADQVIELWSKINEDMREIETARHIIAEVAIMLETARSTLSGHETLNHTDKPPRNA